MQAIVHEPNVQQAWCRGLERLRAIIKHWSKSTSNAPTILISDFAFRRQSIGKDMNGRRSDFELLRAFVRNGDQGAFGDVVRRHIDLVYATALRKVENTGAAEEVAQNVFSALAGKAWRFTPDDSLPAWIYKTTLLEAKEWLRGELRRRRREQTAAELGTTMKNPDEQTTFRTLLPLLDEALLSLREKERTVLLLRFYESQSLRNVGAALGVNEDTAQKRVSSALEKISRFFQRRGYKSATLAAAAALLEKTSASASASSAGLIVNAALKNVPVLTGVAAFLARFTGFTKLQTGAICTALAVAPIAWQWHHFEHERGRAAQMEAHFASTKTELDSVRTEIQKLRNTSAELEQAQANLLAAAAQKAETQEKFETWKKHLREHLLAAEFHWSDDCPFVRIPKSVLRELNVHPLISAPGLISQPTSELLGLAPDERAQLENALQHHFAAMDELVESHVYETNQTQHPLVPDSALDSKIFVVPALGSEASALGNELETAFKSTLGMERWNWIQPSWNQTGTDTLRRTLNLDSGSTAEEIAVWISQSNGELTETCGWADSNSSIRSFAQTLKSFLPGTKWPNPTASYSPYNFSITPSPAPEVSGIELWRDSLNSSLPQSVAQAIQDWLQQEAISRLGANAANP